jgi:hypothetical protein
MPVLALAALVAAPCGANPFWSHWSDGKAELSGYRLTQPRYGQLRSGTAVLVYVTEPYSRSRHVKVDRHDPEDPDQVVVMKLNHVRDFQTGIYDYNAMTSVFLDPARGFAPLEVSFSMQEWCGHVYEEAIFGPGGVAIDLASYFEGESGERELRWPAGAVAEDAILVTARHLAADTLPAAQAAPVEMKLLPGATFRRLRHRPPELVDAKLTWSAAPATVEVPAGRFEVREATYGRGDGSSCTLRIETAYPHRVVGWSCTDGEEAELTGTARLPYWELNREGDASKLELLGLGAGRR